MKTATFRCGDVDVSFPARFVAFCEIQRPPNNFFDVELIEALAEVYENLDEDDACRAIVLASAGTHFCAGADFSKAGDRPPPTPDSGNPLYDAAIRLFRTSKPVVAAIQGAAIGGGFGLALSADFRVGCPEARFAANFVKLGFTPGFGMTCTLPAIVGRQKAAEIMLSGRRVKGEESAAIGLLDRMVDGAELREAAIAMAASFAENAPLAVESLRRQLRADLADKVRMATEAEFAEQYVLQQTEDFREGLRAVSERRAGLFKRH